MTPTLSAALVTPEIVDQVLQLGKAVDPFEACGIITPDGLVVQVPNVSEAPDRHYQLDPEGLANALYEFAARVVEPVSELRREHFIVWHTHPNGNVGPSAVDMRQRVEGFRYLVVAIPSGVASLF